MKNFIMLALLISPSIFAQNGLNDVDILCKVSAEGSIQCYLTDVDGGYDVSKNIKETSIELVDALVDAGARVESGMGTTYITAQNVSCSVSQEKANCKID